MGEWKIVMFFDFEKFKKNRPSLITTPSLRQIEVGEPMYRSSPVRVAGKIANG
jgi:hypothetical protein